jgi:signal transduction histidine kinase
MLPRNSPAVGTEIDRTGVSFALQASLTRTVDAILSDSITAGHDATADDYLQTLGKLIDLIAIRLDGDVIPTAIAIPFGLSATHLELLRVQFIGAIAEAEPHSIDAKQLVTVLTTLEELANQVKLGAQNQFVDRLSAPDALQAVIEVAHDMRAPLGSILFLVDAIRLGQSGPVNQVQERQLGLIYGAALGLSNIACDVVDAVRGNRLVDGRPRPFSIEEVLNSVASIVKPIGEEKQLSIKVVLPRAGGRLGYPAALHRVLLNLLSNALRYTDVGSVTMGCEEPNESTVRFWVEDTGSGIPPNVMSMLYDGFRPTAVGSRFSSAGLGLAICRTLLMAMGSTLATETSVRGTRFSFELEMERAR